MRSQGGTLRLRIEDIDGPRVKRGAAQAAREDLEWLGLDWDGEVLLQSSRALAHREAAESLLAQGMAYPCICTRTEVEEAASAPHESWQDAVVYPGTCRGRFASVAEAREQSGREPALRFRVEVERVPFEDLFLGPQEGLIRGDFVIQKRDGLPAYQLAVVADDAWQDMDEVLRGDDLLVSTPRQLLLYQALGLRPPRFAHTPLVVGEDGKRLAKRHGDSSLARYRAAGVRPEQVVGYLAALSGLRPDPAPVPVLDLLADFRLARVDPRPAVARSDWYLDP